MLDNLDRLLWLCKNECKEELKEHNRNVGCNARTSDSLLRNLASLHRKLNRTGDPLMSEDVHKAKHIRYKMTERADIFVAEYTTAEAFFLDDDVDPCPEEPQPCATPVQDPINSLERPNDDDDEHVLQGARCERRSCKDCD